MTESDVKKEPDTLQQVFLDNIESNQSVLEAIEEKDEQYEELIESVNQMLDNMAKEDALVDKGREALARENDIKYRQKMYDQLNTYIANNEERALDQAEEFSTMSEKLDVLIELQSASTGSIYSYATIYLPFAVIIFLIWRFLSTFIKSY